MNPAILNNQFVQVALPIVPTIFISAWMNGRTLDASVSRIVDVNARIDGLRTDINSRFSEVNRRLDKIDSKLEDLRRWPGVSNPSTARSATPQTPSELQPNLLPNP